MIRTYLVGTYKELSENCGADFGTDYNSASQYAEENNLSILEIEWELSDSEIIRLVEEEESSEEESEEQ